MTRNLKEDVLGGWTGYTDEEGHSPVLDAIGSLPDRQLQARLTQVLSRLYGTLENEGWTLRLPTASEKGHFTYFLVEANVATTNVRAAVAPIHGVPVVVDVFVVHSGPRSKMQDRKRLHRQRIEDLSSRPDALAGVRQVAKPPADRNPPEVTRPPEVRAPGRHPAPDSPNGMPVTISTATRFVPVDYLDPARVALAAALKQDIACAVDYGVQPNKASVEALDRLLEEIGFVLLKSKNTPPAIALPLGPGGRTFKRDARSLRTAGDIYVTHATEDIPLDGPAYGDPARYPEGFPRYVYWERMQTMTEVLGVAPRLPAGFGYQPSACLS